MISVFHTTGDGHGWAIDEDLRQIRESLKGLVHETSLAKAQVVHSPFWMALAMHPPEVLKDRFVIAHADNPPYFYLKQPEFARAQQQVDLWIARSREAEDQFRSLRLPVEHIPYTIDPGLFHPLVKSPGEKAELRKKLGLPASAYLIANFHRDSEGSDLNVPKLQKAPELFVMILRRLKAQRIQFHVLLAGPRRHWLRRQLTQDGIPFTFVGKGGVEEDDFGVNILTRQRLNELYNATDLYLVPSRWEGGPQSIMEAAACRCKILSTPLGVGRDILEPQSLFRSASQAAEIIRNDIVQGTLASTVEPQYERWKSAHTTPAMAARLRDLYARLPSLPEFMAKGTLPHKSLRSQMRQWSFTVQRRFSTRKAPAAVRFQHIPGHHCALDAIMINVRASLERSGIGITDAASAVTLRGWDGASPDGPFLQFVAPGMRDEISPSSTVVAPSVQDIVNLRGQRSPQPAIVIPFVFEPDETSQDFLVVDQGDMNASIRVWRALLAGRPVIYPEKSAYYEQVFHAGLPYRDATGIPELSAIVRNNKAGMRSLARPPEPKAADRALVKLLSEFP